jgi:diguanylate cyclase (GGDEF)-like protein
MRLATITNWAYGATVLLTLVSGTTMLLASQAQDHERAAVAQRYRLDQASSRLGNEVYALSGLAREYVLSGDPTQLLVYRGEARALQSLEERIRAMRDAGASAREVGDLKSALRWADTLHDEQQAAIALRQQGDGAGALQILFGAEYERELDRVENLIERFQSQLDQRTDAEVTAAARIASIWKMTSQVLLGFTALLFIAVLYFVFKRRVLQPVVRLSDVIGRLAAQDYAAEPPTYDQIDEIGDMAQALRVFRENGLERQRLEQERDADRAMRDLLSRMTQRMQGCDTTHELEAVVQRFLPEIAPSLAGRFYLLDASRGALVEACNWSGPRHSRPEFSPLACWALRRGALHRPAGHDIDVPCDHLDLDADERVDAICLPMTAHQETLGLLYLEPRADVVERAEAPEIHLKMLAENIGLALANLRLRDALRGLAMADALTGLANRRQLDTTLATHFAEAERLRRPISCLMLDVDHFKRFNDDFGHDAGDAVLREVGGVLKRATREGNLAFRYGGEEFLMLLPGLEPNQALDRAEEIRRKVESLRVVHDGREVGPITASLGLASSPEHCPVDRLIQTADAALLRAKRAGRNRVVVAEARGADHAAA